MKSFDYGASPDGTLIHYVVNRVPRNPTLVFIHGAGSNHTVWDSILSWFKRRSYLAVDLRNHGLSGFGQFTLAKAVRDVAEVIRKEHIKEFIPVGMSVGALIAAELVHVFPKQAKKAILISPSSKTLTNGSLFIAEAMRWLQAVLHVLPRRRHLRMTKHEKHVPLILNPFWELQGIHARDYARIGEVSVSHELRELTIPTLFITGNGDTLMNKRELAKRKGQHVEIDCHHLLLTRKPDHVAELIATFAEE